MEMELRERGAKKQNSYGVTKVEEKSVKNRILNFLYNGETGEICGRTFMSWLKITIFYIIFFTALGVFFGWMLYIFLLTLNPFEPKWTGTNGLIGNNPGLGFRPMPDEDTNAESTLIWIKRRDEAINSSWANQLTKFFDKHYLNDTPGKTGSNIGCAYGGSSASLKNSCALDVKKLNTACSEGNARYGYENNEGKPCVLIKLNKIIGWKPEPYKTIEDLVLAKKLEMPDQLIKKIAEMIGKSDPLLDTIWITCEGASPTDREFMGPVQYFSSAFSETEFPGIPSYYFPYNNQIGYRAPFVFVKFVEPKHHVLIQVQCTAWAKNILPDRQTRHGLVRFEILID